MKHLHGLTMLATAALLFGLTSSPALARKSSKAKPEVQYPDTTRQAPKLDLHSEKDQKKLQDGLNALNSGDKAKATEVLQDLLDTSKSKYAQAMALRGLALLKYQAGDYKGSIALIQRALADGVVPNDDYFAIEYMLAAVQQADGQYQASLDTIQKWRAEGKKETAESYAIEGNDLYRLEKYPEAIAAIKKAQSLTDKPEPQWNQILMASYSAAGQGDEVVKLAQQELAANPDDPARLSAAITALQQAGKYPEAIKLMEEARAKGSLTTEDEYVLLGSLYFNQALSSDDPKAAATKSIAVLNEGMSKGIMQPSAHNYLLLGKAQYLVGDIKSAMASYNKALPLATDGEAALQIASVLLTDSKYSESKSKAELAISKGVKHPGVAYMVLAECERGLNHKSARIAALKQAANDPQTATRANELLKKLAAKK